MWKERSVPVHQLVEFVDPAGGLEGVARPRAAARGARGARRAVGRRLGVEVATQLLPRLRRSLEGRLQPHQLEGPELVIRGRRPLLCPAVRCRVGVPRGLLAGCAQGRVETAQVGRMNLYRVADGGAELPHGGGGQAARKGRLDVRRLRCGRVGEVAEHRGSGHGYGAAFAL